MINDYEITLNRVTCLTYLVVTYDDQPTIPANDNRKRKNTEEFIEFKKKQV